jgi:hypothetical protein
MKTPRKRTRRINRTGLVLHPVLTGVMLSTESLCVWMGETSGTTHRHRSILHPLHPVTCTGDRPRPSLDRHLASRTPQVLLQSMCHVLCPASRYHKGGIETEVEAQVCLAIDYSANGQFVMMIGVTSQVTIFTDLRYLTAWSSILCVIRCETNPSLRHSIQ